MSTYAGIKFGYVIQTFTPLPEWSSLDVMDLFAAPLFDAWVPIDGMDPAPAYGWRYDGTSFTAPPPDGPAITLDIIDRIRALQRGG